jgi:hypothetical protein
MKVWEFFGRRLQMPAKPVVALALVLTGCSVGSNAGRNATESAISVLAQPVEYQGKIKPVVEHVSGATVRGAVDELNTPAEQQRLGQLVDFVTTRTLATATAPQAIQGGGTDTYLSLAGREVAQGFMNGALSSFQLHLGTSGQGPMSERMDALVARLSATGTDTALRELMVATPDGSAAMGERESFSRMALLGKDFAAGLTLGISRELGRQIGAHGGGPLATTVDGLTQRVAATAVRSAADELAADASCTGPDKRACANARVEELGRAAGHGVMIGALDAIRVPLLILVFALGALVALLASWMFGKSRARSAPVR